MYIITLTDSSTRTGWQWLLLLPGYFFFFSFFLFAHFKVDRQIDRWIVVVIFTQKMKRSGPSLQSHSRISHPMENNSTLRRGCFCPFMNSFKSLILYFKAKLQTLAKEKGKYQPFPTRQSPS